MRWSQSSQWLMIHKQLLVVNHQPTSLADGWMDATSDYSVEALMGSALDVATIDNVRDPGWCKVDE